MNTKFTKLKEAYAQIGATPIKPWVLYFHTSAEWLNVWNLLNNNMDNLEVGGPFFYAKPHVAHFSLELIVKARISYSDSTFVPSANSHHTSRNILQHQAISPIFQEVAANNALLDLIKEYEKTLDTRFGETSVQTKGSDEAQIVNLIRRIRDEMILLTKVTPIVLG